MFLSDVCKDNICSLYRVVLKKTAIFSVYTPYTKTKKKLPTNVCPTELCFHSMTTLNIRQRHNSCMTLPLQQTGHQNSMKCNSTRQQTLNSTSSEMFKCVLYKFESATNRALWPLVQMSEMLILYTCINI